MGMTHTIQGDFLSFKTANQANIESLITHFKPQQEPRDSTDTNNIKPISGFSSIEIKTLQKPTPILPTQPQDIYYSSDNQYRLQYMGNGKFKLLDTIASSDTVIFDINIIPITWTDQFNSLLAISNLKEKIGQFNFTYSLRSTVTSDKFNGYFEFSTTSQCFAVFNIVDPAFMGKSFNLLRVIFTSVIPVNTEFSLIIGNNQNIISHTTNFTEPIYGGQIDLVNGTLTQTWNCITVTSDKISDTVWTNNNVNISWDNFPSTYSGGQTRYTAITSHWNTIYNTGLSHALYCNYRSDVEKMSIIIGKEIIQMYGYTADDSGLINFLDAQENLGTPIQIAYPLTTPIVYQLSSNQLHTLKGQNYFWSNANDLMELEYEVNDSADILQVRKSIYNEQPHIEKISGIISSFNTDLTAPLKECKINFYPAQDSYTNPSLTNIKSISGWNGIQLIRNNFIPIDLKGFTTGQLGSSNGVINYLGNNTYEFIGSPEDGGSVIIPIQPITFLSNTSYHIMIIKELENGIGSENTALNIAFKTSAGSNIFVCRPNYLGWSNNICLSYITFTESKEAASLIIGVPQGSSSFKFKFFLSTDVFNITSINWSTDYGTLYGGYIDLVNGELVQTHGCKILNNPDNWLENQPSSRTFIYDHVIFPIDYSKGNSAMICSIIPALSQLGENDNKDLYCRWYKDTVNNVYFTIRYSSNLQTPPTLNELKQLSTENKIAVAYELNTPIHYSLNSTQLKTLKGANNIWSNTNGPIELTYWTH